MNMISFPIDAGPGKRIVESRLIAVLVVRDAQEGLHVAEALLSGGVDVMELTLRTSGAIDALRAVRQRFPEMTAGIGTILNTEQVDQVIGAGAEFGVSPGVNAKVIRHAQAAGLPFAPGIMTPSDIDQSLVEHDCHLLKFFPAESSGGLSHLRNITAPYAHLGVQFIPLGGIDRNNVANYLESDLVAAVGGSWLAPRSLIEAADWMQIEANAREAREIAGR